MARWGRVCLLPTSRQLPASQLRTPKSLALPWSPFCRSRVGGKAKGSGLGGCLIGCLPPRALRVGPTCTPPPAPCCQAEGRGQSEDQDVEPGVDTKLRSTTPHFGKPSPSALGSPATQQRGSSGAVGMGGGLECICPSLAGEGPTYLGPRAPSPGGALFPHLEEHCLQHRAESTWSFFLTPCSSSSPSTLQKSNLRPPLASCQHPI